MPRSRYSRYTMTEEKRKRWIKEGRGSGDHNTYNPWLTREDVRSNERSNRKNSIVGIWLKRYIETLSLNEDRVFFLYEHALKPAKPLDDLENFPNDLKEQYPMDLDETMEIARSIGVEHPKDSISGVFTVMTTDLFVTNQGTDCGRTVKEEIQLGDPGVIERLEIERIYYDRRNTDWGIILKKDIPEDMAENLRMMRNCYDILGHSELQRQEIDRDYLKKISNYLSGTVQGSISPLAKICILTDERYGLIEGTSLLIAKHLIYTNQWDVDLMKPFQTNTPLILRNINLLS